MALRRCIAGGTVGLEVHVAMPVRGEEMDANGPGIRGEGRRITGDEVDRRRFDVAAPVVAVRPGVVADVPGAAESVDRFPERQRARGPYRESSAGEGRVVERQREAAAGRQRRHGLAERSVGDIERDHRRPIERAGNDPGDQLGQPIVRLRLPGRLEGGAEGGQGLRAQLFQGPRRLLADHAVGRTEAPDQLPGRKVRGQGRRQHEHQAQG